MSSKNNKTKECEKTDVLGKLEKAADSLETASSQLSGVVTQQQLDLVKERVSICESDLTLSKEALELLATRSAVHATESEAASLDNLSKLESLERDYAGLRALTLTSFALTTITLMSLIIIVVLL